MQHDNKLIFNTLFDLMKRDTYDLNFVNSFSEFEDYSFKHIPMAILLDFITNALDDKIETIKEVFEF